MSKAIFGFSSLDLNSSNVLTSQVFTTAGILKHKDVPLLSRTCIVAPPQEE